MVYSRRITLLHRLGARLGIFIITHPVQGYAGVEGNENEYLMVFHYCPQAKQFRFDKHYDLLSHSEGFTCGTCNGFFLTTGLFTHSWFMIQEWSRIMEEEGITSRLARKFYFFKFMFCGLGKYTPLSRDGENSGKLEMRAMAHFLGAVFGMIEHQLRRR